MGLVQRTLLRLLLAALFLAVVGLMPMLIDQAVRGGDETCYPVPVTEFTPSGIAGCTLDGPTDGVASWYPGRSAAAQWCVWPWTDCGWAMVQSARTGVVITVPIGSFCDCYWLADRRLIDLTEDQVHALGEDPADGLIAVTVTPVSRETKLRLPDTAVRAY